MPAASTRITPTAHYTSHVWVANGLSHPALGTGLGRLLHAMLRPFGHIHGLLSDRPGLDDMLLARHRALDHLLERTMVDDTVRQVVEIAAGLSGRGVRFARRFPTLRYVESDLPGMAARKQRILESAGLVLPNHEVVALDALADDGPDSLDALASRLDPGRGTAIVTEGLLSYFDHPTVERMWRRFAGFLGRFSAGLHAADLHLAEESAGTPSARAFRGILSVFTRGRIHLHFGDADEAAAALEAAGFRTATVRQPSEVLAETGMERERQHLVWVVEAWT